jgi:chitin disaccharide deacetylase
MIGSINIFKRIYLRVMYINSSGQLIKKLGYNKGTKLLIIHADDLGISSSENNASIKAMDQGMVTSGSIMVMCPKFQEIVDYSKANPNADFGIHLTLTSEWNTYKWGPVLHPNQVASLVDSKGYFLKNSDELKNSFNADDVWNEFRAQIELGLRSGIDITHLDSHMLTVFSHPVLQNIYNDIGREYKLPVLFSHKIANQNYGANTDVIVDRIYHAQPSYFQNGLFSYYSKVLRSIKPGLTCILIHAAFDNEEMQKITENQPNWGSSWRQADFNFFTSNECRQLIGDRDIHLITWREIRDKVLRIQNN